HDSPDHAFLYNARALDRSVCAHPIVRAHALSLARAYPADNFDKVAAMEETVDPRTRIAEFLDRFARERNLVLPPLSEDGVGHIQRGSAVVAIHVLAEKGVLLLLARIAKTPKIDEPRAKRLLELSFTETNDAAFALHPQTGDLYLRIFRGL